jgi:hypothetical protein
LSSSFAQYFHARPFAFLRRRRWRRSGLVSPFTPPQSISVSRCKKRAYTAAALMLAEQSEEQ